MRAWAREQGLQVGDRGRLPAKLLEQYEAAHAGEARQTVMAPGLKPKGKATDKPTPTGRATKKSAAKPAAKTPTPSTSVRRAQPLIRQAAVSAPVSAKPDQPAPAVPVFSAENDKGHQELEHVRNEVVELRRNLDDVLARLSALEQPRGLFNRSKNKR